MKDYFYQLADHIEKLLEAKEFYKAHFHHEMSDFVRFNDGKIRQPGTVEQADLSVTIIRDNRSSSCSIRLCFDLDLDTKEINEGLKFIRESIQSLPEDPYLLYSTEKQSTESVFESQFNTSEILNCILDAVEDLDFVGIFAAGNISYGFANSTGQRNWHSSSSFNLDWSLYLGKIGDTRDKAVKCNYAGNTWSDDQFLAKLNTAKKHLKLLELPPKSIEPGNYRAYLSPSALAEITSLLNWGGFSERGLQTKQSALFLLNENKQLSPIVNITEDLSKGASPIFQSDGFIKPEKLKIIKDGKLANMLCSPRTAKEYNLEHNSAEPGEGTRALHMDGGELDEKDVLKTLNEGLYISNLWYLNYSDQASGRITGMTRFACFWVENGELSAPINVVRFDDTVYSMLGEKLEYLTKECEQILDPSSYEQRSTESNELPGALLSEFKITL